MTYLNALLFKILIAQLDSPEGCATNISHRANRRSSPKVMDRSLATPATVYCSEVWRQSATVVETFPGDPKEGY